jgi:hypothetical protein
MAQPTVIAGTKLIILVGNAAIPEVFSAPCGLTTSGINFTAATNTTLVPDCDDPEAPTWEARDVSSMGFEVTGSGVMAVESFNVWRDWMLSGLGRNVQIKFDDPGLGYWGAVMKLTRWNHSGARGQKVTVEVSMVSDGMPTWTDI